MQGTRAKCIYIAYYTCEYGGCFVHVESTSTWHGNLFELMQKRIRRAAAFNLGSTQPLWSYGLASVQCAFYDETAVHGFP